MIAAAHARGATANVTYVRCDAQALPIEDGRAEAVTCTESFHWYPDQRRALAEFHRALAARGLLLVAFPNPPFRFIGEVAARWMRTIGQSPHFPTPVEMRRMVQDAGFEVVSQYRARPLPALIFPGYLTVARRA